MIERRVSLESSLSRRPLDPGPGALEIAASVSCIPGGPAPTNSGSPSVCSDTGSRCANDVQLDCRSCRNLVLRPRSIECGEVVCESCTLPATSETICVAFGVRLRDDLQGFADGFRAHAPSRPPTRSYAREASRGSRNSGYESEKVLDFLGVHTG